uniref:Transmembrane protein 181-like n=1 Tax=Sinocyclocheilus anshuiensis TaxID=1608454 RepID=A0A671STT8_9TELE
MERKSASNAAMERPESLEKMKQLCRRIQDAFRELQEDLTPYKTERFYRHFVLVFVVFFFCFGVSTLIGVSGPKIISENYYNGLSVSTNASKSGPFDLRSPPLSNYNQQLWLTCIIQLYSSIADLSWEELGMKVELQGVMQDASVMRISNNVHNKNRSLRCAAHQQACDEIIVLHLGYLNYTQYKINVSFRNLQDGLKDKIKNVTFVFKMYSATFSQVEIWFRFVFVVMTFIVTCVFAHSLRKFSMRDWGIEQKWMSVLLPLLLLYNDPFFPLSFLVNSWFPGTLDAFFQALFLCALLLFWLCVYHGIRVQGDRRFLTFYLPKLLIVGLLWLSAVTLGIWQTVNELQDPTYQYNVDIQNFQVSFFQLIQEAVYVLYLVFLVLCACSELKNAPYTGNTHTTHTHTHTHTHTDVVILYLRFGSKALQDNFVSELSTHYQNYILSFEIPSHLILHYKSICLCTRGVSLLLRPDSQLKDNPAFSMLNDSDDDVIYGSDYEETPLQNGRAIKASAKYQDESGSD